MIEDSRHLIFRPARMIARWVPHSLRTRYLVSATTLSLLVLAAALVTQWGLTQRSRAQVAALALHDRAQKASGRIREAVWSADHELITLLVDSQPGGPARGLAQLDAARDDLAALLADPALARAGLDQAARTLKDRLDTLRARFAVLIERRRDPAWVYPALPYISEILLGANIDFETAARLAIDELEDSLDDPTGRELYRQCVEIRDLWRRIILNFRAIMIRYAGLPIADPAPQEQNVEQLFQALREQLEAASARASEAGDDFFVTANSLATMRTRSRDWHANFQKVKVLRRSTQWRGDVNYVRESLRPALVATFEAFAALDEALAQWNRRNAEYLRATAHRGSILLWIAVALVLLFAIATYILLRHSVLEPVRRLAATLQGVTRGTGPFALPPTDTRELQDLANAFEVMHERVSQRQAALEHQALHDALTGLPNRVLLHDRLAHALQNARRRREQVGILLLDLNRFKEINDTLGHHAGDLLLQEVAQRLLTLLRDVDTVARLGGDEFAIVLTAVTKDSAMRLAQRVADALETGYRIAGHTIHTTASMGIALYPTHGEDEGTLLRHADVAMYLAKQSKRPVAVYEAGLDRHSGDYLDLAADLRAAVEGKTLEVHYQPRIALADESVVGVEALLRWRHLRQGWIPPEEVVRLAEHTGLITPITELVIGRAVDDWAALAQRSARLDLSVNISPWALHNQGLSDHLAALLSERPGEGGRLILEITEGAVMYDPPAVRLILQQLHDLGAEIALDDFGTGFSSLSHLKLLPLKELKIDRTFVSDMLTNDSDAGIVQAVIELGHHLGLRVTAEGVGNRETLVRLRQLGCDLAQGFYWTRPMPATELDTWLACHATGG